MRHTFLRILSTLPFPTTQDFPLQFQIADGLDGSGSHTVYNQTTTNTETKSFILFCFRPIKIIGCSGNILWKNVNPNSPFTQRPIFLHAAKENKENIKHFMFDIINSDTKQMQNEGYYIDMIYMSKLRLFDRCLMGRWQPFYQVQEVHAVKYVPPLSIKLKDRDLIIQGFPINRHISDALQLFGDLEDSESFLKLPSNERFNITHEPLSTINILPDSTTLIHLHF